MADSKDKILIWLPSPMGDAILCTPALRAIRSHLQSAEITFVANSVVRNVLSPCPFNDKWIDLDTNNPFLIGRRLAKLGFKRAILLKNSFGSALSVALAGIPSRIGYARQCRSPLLTERLAPPRTAKGKFKPISMVNYYLAIASKLGADTADRSLSLVVNEADLANDQKKLPQVFQADGPLIILVPGGAFGPSKCWPSRRFAETADWLIENHNATVIVSVAPDPAETRIAREICEMARNKLINLARSPLTMGELKALFSIAALTITNDTGPRHIAIALGRKVVTLFGPNDPAWTDTNYVNEIQLIGNVSCSPCSKPKCNKREHLCMQSITTQMLQDAAREMLDNNRTRAMVFAQQQLEQTSEEFFVDAAYKEALDDIGLDSIEAIFRFESGQNLSKSNLASYRSRIRFEAGNPPTTIFLKRYNRPPVSVQLKNWLAHHARRSCACYELEPAIDLASAGINVPKVVAYGQQWAALLEDRSFIATEKIPNAEALERRLPNFITNRKSPNNPPLRRDFIISLADFIRKFHATGYRHRDLYLSHIFHDDNGKFHLIDLARAFQPTVFHERFRIKDIAQLHFSTPAKFFSNTDRLRFYLTYTRHDKLTKQDNKFIRNVVAKAHRMARHDVKHGRTAPFLTAGPTETT